MVGQVLEHLPRHSRTTHATAARPYPCMSSNPKDWLRLPSQQELHELFRYDEKLGGLVWRTRRQGPGKFGVLAGFVDKTTGRRGVKLGYTRFRHARLVWCWHNGDPGSLEVDHIDGDSSNDRIENLRLASREQNMRNTRLRSNNTSGHKGVYYRKDTRMWGANIAWQGKLLHLGFYDTKEDAAKVRKAKELELFGEFSAITSRV